MCRNDVEIVVIVLLYFHTVLFLHVRQAENLERGERVRREREERRGGRG